MLHAYEIRPRKDHRGVDLISDAVPFGRLLYGDPNAVSNAIGYAEHRSRSHDAVIRVYSESGNVIQTHHAEAGLRCTARIQMRTVKVNRCRSLLPAESSREVLARKDANAAAGSFPNMLTEPNLTSALAAGLHPAFFGGEVSLGNGVYYLQSPNGTPFGYYSYLTDPHFIYHFDMGYEYLFDANDGNSGIFTYDFASNDFFYASPSFPFPYLYDFGLNSVLYYYPDPNRPGHYTSNPRYFFDFATGQIITR